VQVKAADRELVAVQKPAPVDALTVHEQPVEAAVVEHPQWFLALPDDQRVAARDSRVVEPDVRGDAAADPGPAALEGKDLKVVVLEDEIAAGGVERVSRGLEPGRCRRLRGDRKLGRGGRGASLEKLISGADQQFVSSPILRRCYRASIFRSNSDGRISRNVLGNGPLTLISL